MPVLALQPTRQNHLSSAIRSEDCQRAPGAQISVYGPYSLCERLRISARCSHGPKCEEDKCEHANLKISRLLPMDLPTFAISRPLLLLLQWARIGASNACQKVNQLFARSATRYMTYASHFERRKRYRSTNVPPAPIPVITSVWLGLNTDGSLRWENKSDAHNLQHSSANEE